MEAQIDKYDNFVKSVKSNKEIWLLQATEGMFAMFEDNSGQEYMPVWLEKDEANKFIKDDWEDYLPEKMSLFEFMGWLKELANDEVCIAVTPDNDLRTIPMKAGDLREHLSS